jgi:hypothetical protein
MSKRCEDCGCILEKGVCSNCQEELFIVENQSEFIDRPLSEEFLNKVNEQEELVKSRRLRDEGIQEY